MKFDLSALARSGIGGNRRPRTVVLRPIEPTNALASDLYQVAYKPLINAMTAAIPRIVAAYETGLPIRDGLITDSPDQAQRVTTDLGAQLSALVLSLAPGLRGWASRVTGWHTKRWRGAILTATKIDAGTLLQASGTPTAVQTYIDWNIALMRDVGQQAQQRISQAVFTAYQARKPAADLARDIRSIVGMSRARSLRIAGDQLSKMASALDKERMDDAGIETFRYRHGGKLHPRKWHLARDGKEFELESGRQVDGSDVIEPGDEPGQPPFCGCRRQAVLHF